MESPKLIIVRFTSISHAACRFNKCVLLHKSQDIEKKQLRTPIFPQITIPVLPQTSRCQAIRSAPSAHAHSLLLALPLGEHSRKVLRALHLTQDALYRLNTPCSSASYLAAVILTFAVICFSPPSRATIFLVQLCVHWHF